MGTHDIRVTNKQQKENQEHNIPDIMFGVPTRPSTPIFDLLEHKYQKIWAKEQAHKQDKAKEAAKVGHRVGKQKGGDIIVFETRASQMRRHRPGRNSRITAHEKIQKSRPTFGNIQERGRTP